MQFKSVKGQPLSSIGEEGKDSDLIFPEDAVLQKALPDSFILNIPKTGFVSGDGFWTTLKNSVLYMAVYDCTGHGHLANMMGRVYKTALEKIVIRIGIEFPGAILEYVHREIQSKFREKPQKQVATGADFGVVRIDLNKKTMGFAGAKLNLLRFAGGKINIIKGDRIQVGEMFDYRRRYHTNTIDIRSGYSRFYLATDGAKELIGGKANRKIGIKNLKSLLVAHSNKPMKDQGQILYKFLTNWKKENEPPDDILIIGFIIKG